MKPGEEQRGMDAQFAQLSKEAPPRTPHRAPAAQTTHSPASAPIPLPRSNSRAQNKATSPARQTLPKRPKPRQSAPSTQELQNKAKSHPSSPSALSVPSVFQLPLQELQNEPNRDFPDSGIFPCNFGK